MLHQEKFQAAYKELNTDQRLAVDTIDGPVMVIAGPGTGKTQILTLRIAKILFETDTAPESILALTFTESGVKAMRERLRLYVGTSAYKVPIMTFHGFADYLIQSYPDEFNHLVGSVPISDLERLYCMEKIVDSGIAPLLRPTGDPYYYVTSLIKQVSDMKREYITPEKLSLLIDEEYTVLSQIDQFHEKGPHKGKERSEYKNAKKQLEKNQSLLAVYRLYQTELKTIKRYDFEDMILEAVSVLESNESIRLDTQERFQYVLADEHQDVNQSQNKILQLITEYHSRPNIFVVGDEKQAIYRFQGASLENFLFFDDYFQGTKTISLEKNYRSNQTILDFSHHIIESNDETLKALRIPLKAEAKTKGGVNQLAFEHEHLELCWIVHKIHELKKVGFNYSDIAIILRTNKEVELYTRELRAKGLNVVPSADSDINLHPLVKSVRALLGAIIDPTDEKILFEVIHGSYLDFSTQDIIKILTLKNTQRVPLSEVVFILPEEVFSDEMLYKKIINFRNFFSRTREKISYESPDILLGNILRDSGLVAYAHKIDIKNGFRVIRRLLDAVDDIIKVNHDIDLQGIVHELERHEQYNIPLNVPYIPNGYDAVNVMTAHKSKGLEFPVVFVPNVIDRKWGGKQVRNLFKLQLTKTTGALDTEDDDRRLLYVAITRAQEELYVSYSDNSIEGTVSSPSRLINLDTYQFTKHTQVEEDNLFSLQTSSENIHIPYKYLTEIFLSRGLSATALNNYMSSPWTFLYRNLLRIPEVQPLHMKYGTLIHSVLERAVKKKNKDNVLLTSSEIDTIIRTYLKKIPLTVIETTQLHEKALASLPLYIEDYFTEKINEATFSVPEFRITTELSDSRLVVESLKLTGSLDRVDYDAEGNILRVVDYKTGKSKSRNAIEGNTKDGDKSYKRQLIFYALLLQLQNLHHDAVIYELSFVEPTASGKIVSHGFMISNEEIEDLKTEIITIGNDIVNEKFLEIPCDPHVCDYCDYAKQLVSKG